MYEILSKVIIKSCLKNREHEKTKYEIQYTKFYEIFYENMIFFNCIF